MGRRIRTVVQRPHSLPVEAEVVDAPSATDTLAVIRSSPHSFARWVLARERIFLTTSDITHGELVDVPRSLGLVYSTDGALWWDEARHGFRLYVNDPGREALVTTERAFWRMVDPHPVFVIPPAYRHHLDAPEDGWVRLHPGTKPARDERRGARRDEAARRAWEEHGVARLRTLDASLPRNPGDNYASNLRGKLMEAMASGPPTFWNDGNRTRSERIDWRCDEDGSFAEMAGRRVAVSWSDRSTRHPVYAEAIVDHFRIVRVDEAWDDGEALDPVDRILVEAEICGMLAADGIETVPPEAARARQEVADGLAAAPDAPRQDP